MEDILAIVVVLATIGVIAYTVSKIIAHRREQAEAEAHRKELMDRLNAAATRDRERMLAKVTQKPLHEESESDLAYMREHNLITAAEASAALRKKRTFVKREEPTPVAVATTSDSNLLSDLANIAIIANTVNHWNDNAAHRVEHSPEPERSVGVTTKESSWGFDDSDSRKSISSSMDTSSSWSSSSSSSSSSYSSSSDSSSPSSDW